MMDRTSRIENRIKDSEELKMSLCVYLKFWSFIVKKQFLKFFCYSIFLVGMASLTPIFIFLWKQYIDRASIAKDFTQALTFLVTYVSIKLIQDLCYFFSTRFMDTLNFSSWRVLDKAINHKATHINNEYFEIPNIQNKINRAWEFSHGSYIELYQLGFDSFRYIVQLIGIFVSLYIISPATCLISLITILPAIISKVILDKISILANRHLDEDERECAYYKNVVYDQFLIKEIILKNAFDFFEEKYESKSLEVFTKKKSIEFKKARLLFLEEMFRNVIIVICTLFTTYQMIIGNISLGALASIFYIIVNLIYLLTDVAQNVGTLFTITYHINQFYEFMDLDSENHNITSNIPHAEKDNGDIEFRDVSYRYPLTNEYVLRNLNLSIKNGQHIAIVGANGSGKTTFIKLLTKLIEPSIGEISYAGRNLVNVDSNEYWNQFSMVFQDFSKYKDTLRYNVSISNVNHRFDIKKIKDALSKAEFHKNIDIECMLSKEFGGIELSGGEWQKIALARSIFHSNSIFILDEPTASIDPIKEAEIYRRFAEMTKDKTSIFVTHRLGSVLYSDFVLFFQDGEIVECGTHHELVQKKGLYYKFWETQSSVYRNDLVSGRVD